MKLTIQFFVALSLGLVSISFGLAQHPGWQFADVPSSRGWESGESFGWYRAYVKIPAEWEGSRLLLIAGEIGGVDEGFFNGRKIGANGAMPPLYNRPASSVRRPFVIEPDWVRFGEDNLVAWRVYSPGGKGGILRGPVHLTRKEDAIDLSGRWFFRVGDSPAWSDWHNSPGNDAAEQEVDGFRHTAGANHAGHAGIVPADKKHREEMIAAVYKKFDGNPNPYARNDDKGNPLGPDASRETFVLSDGLAVDTVLAEPLVRQPLYADFDERGRLWVVQYIQYPNPAGLEVLTWDNHLRKIFDQVPPPPPYDLPGKESFIGSDRITIHEDSDGDGLYDRHKVFLEGLNLATSVTRGRGGVWVMQPPYLLFYPDANNDDVPDNDPVVHLSGFGLEDTHSIANSLKWGPDGWLYGGVGSTVTARVRVHLSGSDERHSFFGQNIWRYHPEKHIFELFAEGGWNTFGVDFDDKGRLYSGTNGNLQAVHFVQGGYYQKNFGKHGPHTNPHVFGHFHGIPIEGEKVRLVHQWIYYKSGAIPSLEGLLVGGNSLASKLHALRMDVRGGSFATFEKPNPLRTDHKWFRPVHCTVGPDGAIYISDFYDARITHVDPRDNWDRDRGRIYRLRDAGAGFAKARDLSVLTSAELVPMLGDGNQWVRRTAQRLLADRKDETVLPLLLERLMMDDGQGALEALWAVHGIGALSDTIAVKAMNHTDAHVRSWAVRLMGDPRATLLPEVFDEFMSRAKSDPEPVVVSQLASTAARLPSPQALPVIGTLVGRKEFAQDPFIPQQLWWALEVQITRDPLRALDLFETAGFWNHPVVVDRIAERIGRRFMAHRTPENLDICARLLDQATGAPLVNAFVRGMELALEGTSMDDVPAALDGAIARLWQRYPNDNAIISFAMRLKSSKALGVARSVIADDKRETALRIQFIGKLSELGDSALEPVLLDIVADEQADADVRLAAINGLRRFAGAAIPEALLAHYVALTPTMRKTAQSILASRADWSASLLSAVDRGVVPRESVTFDVLLFIQSRGDETANALIKKHWGALRQPAEVKARRMEEIKKLLAGGSGDHARGQILFASACGLCHQLGETGRAIAPDLTGYERDNLDFLLPAIVDPNLGVREEYELVTVTLRSTTGDAPAILSGFISNATEQTLTIRDMVGNDTVVARRDISDESRSPVSIMPEGLLDSLSEQQILDLFAFLQAK